MSGKLSGKSLVIIGGTSGLGLSAAKAFLAEGARVVIVGRHREKLAVAEKELGGGVAGFAGDATDPATAPAAIEMACERAGGFHGLYHVAGGSGRRMGDGPLHEISDAGWHFTIDQNLSSLLYSNRAAVQQFLRQKSGGSILNMSSVLAFSPSPAHFATHSYAAAKAAVIGMTKAAAAFYAENQIRFNTVAPASVATPMSERVQESQSILEFIRSKQPLDGGRIGYPADLDAAAVFFLSDDSKFVTGQVLAVDGGWCVSEGHA